MKFDNCYRGLSFITNSDAALSILTVQNVDFTNCVFGVYNSGSAYSPNVYTFSQVTFSSITGAGFYHATTVRRASATFDNCTFTKGGRLYAYYLDTLVVKDTIFSNGSVSDGAISFSFGSTITVTNSTFNDISVTSVVGAPINIASTGILATISDNIFTNNGQAGGNVYGGAIFSSGDTLRVNNCLFSNNTANGTSTTVTHAGGAIYVNSGQGIILNSAFIENAVGTKSSGMTPYGGAIYAVAATHVSNCLFKGNSVVGDGGCGGALAVSLTNIDLQNSTLVSNVADSGSAYCCVDDGIVLPYNNDIDTPQTIACGVQSQSNRHVSEQSVLEGTHDVIEEWMETWDLPAAVKERFMDTLGM